MNTSRKAKTPAGEQSYVRIIAATRELIAEGDLHSLKLDSVAARSGIAKSSILWHFGTKNGLLLAVVEDIFASIQSWVMAIDRDTVFGTSYLKAALATLADGFQKHPEANALLISFITNKTIDPDIRNKIQALYQQYRQFIHDVLKTENIVGSPWQAAAILAFVDGAYLQWYLDPQEIDLKALLLSIADIFEEPKCTAK